MKESVIKELTNLGKKSVMKKGVMLVFTLMAVMVMIALASAVSSQNNLANIYGNGYNMRLHNIEFADVTHSGAYVTDSEIIATSSVMGGNNLRIRFNMRNLPVKSKDCSNVFDVWLVDINMNKILYLGNFKVGKTGKICVTFSKKQVNYPPFDYIAVTQRCSDDNAKLILLGDTHSDP